MSLPLHRRQFLSCLAGCAGMSVSDLIATEGRSVVLDNGIMLPARWPPRLDVVPWDSVKPPYLTEPPSVIPIDTGRQLFVDDFLIESTDLKRVWHDPVPHPRNPILRPDRDWEMAGKGPMAMVFSDGVWFDPRDQLFKMWYVCGTGTSTCYAVSEDGLRWKKPALDVERGTNIVLPGERDSTTVWLDHTAKDPRSRFKLFRSHFEDGRWGLSLYLSCDGIHWGERVLRTAACGDRSTVFYNPFSKVWVYSLRNTTGPRARRYWETADLFHGPLWETEDQPYWWTGADRLDRPRADQGITPQLDNLDCQAYESVLLGLFSVWYGDRNEPRGRPCPTVLSLGFSRDGFHWDRPHRRPFLDVSERKGSWNWGNVQSAGGGCLVVGDQLYFYYSGRGGTPGRGSTRDTDGSTGLAILRRDGFASMAAGSEEKSLTTRCLRFCGKYLFVNLACGMGRLQVEVLDQHGVVIPGFGRAESVAVQDDTTRQEITWKTRATLEGLAGKIVKFRFWVRDGRLYSFWVSKTSSGASQGYVAAGGPGLTGPTDSVGRG